MLCGSTNSMAAYFLRRQYHVQEQIPTLFYFDLEVCRGSYYNLDSLRVSEEGFGRLAYVSKVHLPLFSTSPTNFNSSTLQQPNLSPQKTPGSQN